MFDADKLYKIQPGPEWGHLQARIVGNDIFAPVFKENTHLLLDKQAKCEEGDAVVVSLKNGDIYLGYIKTRVVGGFVVEAADRRFSVHLFKTASIESVTKIKAVVFR